MIALLIPAYQPGRELLEVLETISGAHVFAALIVVNGGSCKESAATFDRAAQITSLQAISHSVNMGKGAALRTGLRHISEAFAAATGVKSQPGYDGKPRASRFVYFRFQLRRNSERVLTGFLSA